MSRTAMALAALFCTFAMGCDEPRIEYPLDDTLRMNQLQCEGTHNSYHLRNQNASLPHWDYNHAPLDVQLESQGVRKFEIDIRWNFATGAYDVLHLPIIDPETTCATFVECLTVIRGWSRRHPRHHPIFIQIEPKYYPPDLTSQEAADAIDAMDAEIYSVFDREDVITPDEVQGSYATLDEAVTTGGWPTLGETRGRVLFFYNCDRELCEYYANGGTSLAGRAVFADSDPGDPWSAIRIHNSPTDPAIPTAVAAGYLVRTFSESITDVIAGQGDELDAALASGAQIISTDFPAPRDDSVLHYDGVTYFVEIPGGAPSRCNPINAPPECTSHDIEHPRGLR